jgi:hypothetical protein
MSRKTILICDNCKKEAEEVVWLEFQDPTTRDGYTYWHVCSEECFLEICKACYINFNARVEKAIANLVRLSK